MKKKQLLILLPILLAVGFLIWFIQRDAAATPSQQGPYAGMPIPNSVVHTLPPNQTNPSTPGSTDSNPTGTDTLPDSQQPQQSTPQTTNPQQTDSQTNDPQNPSGTPTDPQSTSPNSTEPTTPNSKPTEPKPSTPVQTQPTEPEDPTIKFPYAIPNSDIVVLSVNSYDGVFLEDGSTTEATGLCSLLIKNNGSTDVELISITMNRDGELLLFIASDVPAGSFIFVQERNGAKYEKGEYTDFDANIADAGELDQSGNEILVEDNQDGSLTVTNVTDKDFSEVRLFYKFYMADEDVYVGGITYTVRIQSLHAHESITVQPSHYHAGGSKVVMVRTYD